MSENDHPEDHDGQAADATDESIWSRTTAPQSAFTTRQVGIGLVVFAVLALVAFLLPLALA